MQPNHEQKQNVLIVDDDHKNLSLLSEYLNTFNLDILVALNGESGLQKAAYAQPDLILLDVVMPELDGFETCRRLKANPATQHIPVIFLTSLTETEHKLKGFQVGAVDYIIKPLQHEEVLARVMTHLYIQKLTKNLQRHNIHLQKMTDALKLANASLFKRTIQLETGSQISQQITSILELDQLLTHVVETIRSAFGYDFIGIWLLSEAKDVAVLKASASTSEEQPVPLGYQIPLYTSRSIIAWVCQFDHYYLTNNVHEDNKYLALEGLSQIHSELALVLKVGADILGVLDIQSNQLDAFDQEDRFALQSLTNQVAVAIHNAQLYEKEKKRRQTEEMRNQVLLELNANKDKFFSIVSHDLRNPFTSLMMNTEIILRKLNELTKPEIEQRLQKVYNAAEAAYNLLENLLTWSQMQRGYLSYEPACLKLHHLVTNAITLFQGIAAKKNIQLSNKIPAGIDVYADKHILDTVIRNLISNALKFTHQGGEVTLSAQIPPAHKTSSAHEEIQMLQVLITDNGIGIKKEDLDSLFKLEFHHTTPGTEQEGGSGLGLIICQEMVMRNGGDIWVDSEPGQGTTVTFTVPLYTNIQWLSPTQDQTAANDTPSSSSAL